MPASAEEVFSQCKLPPELRNLKPMIANGGRIICLLPEGHVIGEVSSFSTGVLEIFEFFLCCYLSMSVLFLC